MEGVGGDYNTINPSKPISITPPLTIKLTKKYQGDGLGDNKIMTDDSLDPLKDKDKDYWHTYREIKIIK